MVDRSLRRSRRAGNRHLLEYVEPGPFGLESAVVPSEPVQLALYAAVAALIFLVSL
jgi:hypothetical protein